MKPQFKKNELCGHMTKTGEQCTMPKGHAAPFHRSRKYNKPITWEIKTGEGMVIDSGDGRVELGYSLTHALVTQSIVFIEVKKPKV
jgi:hypothetical protein